MRGVSPVPREGVGNLPPAAARRLYPTLRLIIAVLLLCEFVVLGVIQQYNIYKKNCYFYLKKATIVLYVMLAIALAIWYNK